MNIRMLAAAGLAMLCACARETPPPHEPVPNENAVRATGEGEVIGFETADGAYSWRGLPYATAPVGNARWRAPQPPAERDGALVATQYGERCAQMSNRFTEIEGIKAGQLIGSEDCLYLDIYAPKDAVARAEAGDRLAVMVWIHGGSNVWGRGSSYEGSRLAVNEGVIVVTIQYRLGPFGFFSHPLLRDDAEGDLDRAANFALLDQAAALQWVRDNIAGFGGDPERVTIFGESAGAYDIGALLVSPPAKGLFQRAILQSGGFDSVSRADAEEETSVERNPSNAIVAKLGATTADDLRAASARQLLEAYGMGYEDAIELPTVIEDGVTIPAAPLIDALATPGAVAPVAIITGVNRDEMKFFNAADKTLTKKVLGVFTVPRDKAYYHAINAYMSRLWRARSVDRAGAALAAAGHDDVYAYRLDWDEEGRAGFSDLSTLIGAAHAVDIPFIFNRFILFGDLDKTMFTKKTAASREELSRAMGAYWANFARDGVPSAEGYASWPTWSHDGGTLMRFDSVHDGGIAPMTNSDSVEAIIADIKADPSLTPQQRCDVASAVRAWVPHLSMQMAGEIGCPQAYLTGGTK
ncbi:MAG: carboxylesterase family protein [Parvularculaceae bacterium]